LPGIFAITSFAVSLAWSSYQRRDAAVPTAIISTKANLAPLEGRRGHIGVFSLSFRTGPGLPAIGGLPSDLSRPPRRGTARWWCVRLQPD
jgi:hypothetical protein